MKLQLFCDKDLLFDSTTDTYKATEINLTEQVNTTNTLTFTLPVFNPNYSKPQKMTSLIELYRNDVLIFEGRVLYTEDNIIGNRTFTCEGSLAYLLDSIQRPKEYHNTTVQQYLMDKIEQHNAMVETQKQFTVGNVTVTNTTDNVYRIDNDYPNTLTNIQEKLVNRLGGYLNVRKSGNVRYLDYLEEYGTTSEQKIEFQKNILDLSQRISAEDVITCLIPLGAKDETTELPLTIKDVNNGNDFIVDETAISLFGYIFGTNTWDDVTDPNNLKTKGEEFLSQNIKASVSIEVNAVDLSMLSVDINALDLGMSVEVISSPHNLDDFFVIKKKETKFLQPEDSSITLDTIIKRNTDQMSSNNRELEDYKNQAMNQFIQIVQEQTQLITGGKGGYFQFGFNDAGLPSELYFMDNSDKDLAKNVLRINMNGIGFSSNGIDGPYSTAWTLDGKFNASFITAGILQGIKIICDSGSIGGMEVDGQLLKYSAPGYVTPSEGKQVHGTMSIVFNADGSAGNNIYSFEFITNEGLTYSDGYLSPDEFYSTNIRASGMGSYVMTVRNYLYAKTATIDELNNSSSEDLKTDIRKYEDEALQKVLNTDVYKYRLKSQVSQYAENIPEYIGFIIGDKYNLTKDILGRDGNCINLYSAIALLYKAIQEMYKEMKK